MLYAILCYDHESVVGSWTKDEDDAVMAKLGVVQEKMAARGLLGPVARLAGTTKAKTLKRSGSTMVVDGPFAETKEQLLGFFVVDCETIEEAIEFARELGRAKESEGSYEIRPITFFAPNKVATS